MKKSVTMITLLLLMIAGTLSGCGHEHVWREATCKEPMVCIECGKTQGRTAEHEWEDADCTKPKTCSVCGETRGAAAGHTWNAATCMVPKTCSVCGATEGEPQMHSLDDAGQCKVCGKQIRVYLDLTNYSEYLDIIFYKKREIWDYTRGIEEDTWYVKAEPKVEGEFRVTFSVKMLIGSSLQCSVDESGHMEGRTTGLLASGNAKVPEIEIDGYVVCN